MQIQSTQRERTPGQAFSTVTATTIGHRSLGPVSQRSIALWVQLRLCPCPRGVLPVPPRDARSHFLTMGFTQCLSPQDPPVGVCCPQCIKPGCVWIHTYDGVFRKRKWGWPCRLSSFSQSRAGKEPPLHILSVSSPSVALGQVASLIVSLAFCPDAFIGSFIIDFGALG